MFFLLPAIPLIVEVSTVALCTAATLAIRDELNK